MNLKLKYVATAIIVVLVCISFFINLSSQEKEWTIKQVTENIQKRYEMIDDITATYEHHIKQNFTNLEQSFNGVMIIKKPNYYKIESEHHSIVTDGITVWMYTKVNNQVIIDTYKENNNAITPDKFILNLPDNYYATLLGSEPKSNGKILILKLVPKDDRSIVKSVKIFVETNNWIIKKIIIIDVNETETTYTINDIKINTNVPSKTFKYDPPEGIDIVDLRR